jgi:excisionase family DNA binding protein
MRTEPPHPARLLTAAEVAESLGVTAETVIGWAHEAKIASLKLGGQYRFGPEDADFLSLRDVAEICSVSPETVAEWRKSGRIVGFVKLGQSWRISVAAFRAWVADLKQQHSPSSPKEGT